MSWRCTVISVKSCQLCRLIMWEKNKQTYFSALYNSHRIPRQGPIPWPSFQELSMRKSTFIQGVPIKAHHKKLSTFHKFFHFIKFPWKVSMFPENSGGSVRNICQFQPWQIYYNLYNILYGTARHTISIKVGKIYFTMFNSDLYYTSTRKSHIYTIKVTKLMIYSIVSH